jgi:hypothetical protein
VRLPAHIGVLKNSRAAKDEDLSPRWNDCAVGLNFDLRPIPCRLARHDPARLRHELAVAPRMHGVGPDAKAHGNRRRPDRDRLAGRLGSPTRHTSTGNLVVVNGAKPTYARRISLAESAVCHYCSR